MNRRGFLARLLGALGVVAAAPAVLEALELEAPAVSINPAVPVVVFDPPLRLDVLYGVGNLGPARGQIIENP